MRVLSISGKKRSTKRRSSKLRRRKGRYSGGSNSGENNQEEFKEDEPDMKPEDLALLAQQKQETLRARAAEAALDSSLDVRGSQNTKSVQEYQDDIQKILEGTYNEDGTPITSEKIESFFRPENGVKLKCSNVYQRITELLVSIYITVDVPTNINTPIFNFNSFIKLLRTILTKITDEPDEGEDLHTKITVLLYCLMMRLFSLSPSRGVDVDMQTDQKPSDINLVDLKPTNGLTPAEIESMRTTLAKISDTMNPETNDLPKQGKDLEEIYVKILIPLYNKLTKDPEPERVNGTPTGITPESIPPSNTPLLNRPPGAPGESSSGVSFGGGKSRKRRKSRSRRSTRKKSRKTSRRRTTI
jgi:hypothetical protein